MIGPFVTVFYLIGASRSEPPHSSVLLQSGAMNQLDHQRILVAHACSPVYMVLSCSYLCDANSHGYYFLFLHV